ncbi:MAG: hypothetical protein NTU72_12980 [Fimbriimonadales bacterium]|nr:hypothetical protein [Fimbriimonadales bacterium]
MESSELHLIFKALGDPTRLKIFNFLRSCNQPVSVDDSGEARIIDGPTAGDILANTKYAQSILLLCKIYKLL